MPEDAPQSTPSNDQDAPQNPPENESSVPYHRFREVNEKKKAAESRISDLTGRLNEFEERQETEKGEYKGLADRYKKERDGFKQKFEDLKYEVARSEKFRTFTRASRGIILADAVDDAFAMLPPGEIEGLERGDEDGFKALAQNLADRKPYLRDEARGAGSRGSDRPVAQVVSSKKGGPAKKSFPTFDNRKNHFR